MNAFYGWLKFPAHRVILREIDLRGFQVDERLCFCGSGKPYYQCHDSFAANSAMACLFEAFRMIDADIRSAVPPPSCKRGCVDCCSDYFEVSAAEFFAILTHLQKRHTLLPFSRIRQVQKAASALLPLFPAYTAYSELSGKRLVHPCVFLDTRGGRCRIYEVRPLICRMYGYYSAFGNCLSAKDQIGISDVKLDDYLSQFLGEQILPSGRMTAPLAAPLVYWFGSPLLKSNGQPFQKLFSIAHDQSMQDYVYFSVYQDFSDWFSM